jgi:glucose-1-phosphate thymidylyltransferase
MSVGQQSRKAVILARGLGTRMRLPSANSDSSVSPQQAAVAETGAKGLIPISGDRPFLDYVLTAAADAQITDVCFIVAPDSPLRDLYAEAKGSQRLQFHFAIQEQALGTADALLSAEAFAGGESFLVFNSDNYYPATLLADLRRQQAPALPVFDRESLIRDAGIPRERILRYALLEIASDGYLLRIVEKPDAETARAMSGAPVSMNCWHFSPMIFEACRRVKPSARGELELPLAVQLAIDELGARFTTFRSNAPVLDLSHREDIAHVASRLSSLEVRL